MNLLTRRIHLTGMVGAGRVEDDTDLDGKDDYRFAGREISVRLDVLPAALVLAFRYDALTEERFENDQEDTRNAYTLGVTHHAGRDLCLRANYIWRTLDSDSTPDLNDNALMIAAQVVW